MVHLWTEIPTDNGKLFCVTGYDGAPRIRFAMTAEINEWRAWMFITDPNWILPPGEANTIKSEVIIEEVGTGKKLEAVTFSDFLPYKITDFDGTERLGVLCDIKLPDSISSTLPKRYR